MSKLDRIMNEAKELLQDDDARFLKNWVKNPLQMGAITPSSPALAKKMASYVDITQQGRVLELGPGTGPVTEALIKHGIAEERLILIEFDASFVKMLHERFPKATIIQGDAYTLTETLKNTLAPHEQLAAIISGLPLVTKPDTQRLSLLREALNMLAPNAPFIQFTYAPLSPIPEIKSEFSVKGSVPIWRNVPPARVFVYRKI
jgi:phosphatidylethanolamine/phosphatidyl-N-methylethanolamine N-methyltransferase